MFFQYNPTKSIALNCWWKSQRSIPYFHILDGTEQLICGERRVGRVRFVLDAREDDAPVLVDVARPV